MVTDKTPLEYVLGLATLYSSHCQNCESRTELAWHRVLSLSSRLTTLYIRTVHRKFSSSQLLFNRSIVNVIWAITVGKRYSYDDEKLEELVGKVNKMLQTFNPAHPALW